MKENKRVSYKTGVKKYFLSNTKDKKGQKNQHIGMDQNLNYLYQNPSFEH